LVLHVFRRLLDLSRRRCRAHQTTTCKWRTPF
jgi:hypothetical protein